MADKRGLLGEALCSAPQCGDAGALKSETATHPEDRSNLPESFSEVAV
jgi:hypothetical protein